MKERAVLTIAGSDGSGGAGVQADLRTFFSLGVHGVSAITCVTAQNPKTIARIASVEPAMVALQIKTVCDAFNVVAAKTGMLYSAEIARAVARAVTKCSIRVLVVDPVMTASSGRRLLRKDAIKALCSALLPNATVVTPNLSEAEALCGRAINSLHDLENAAREIGEKFGIACVAKGGHLRIERGARNAEQGREKSGVGTKERSRNTEAVDVLYHHGKTTVFSAPRIDVRKTHGTGCVFSAALTSFLALGEDIVEAVGHAKEFVAAQILNSRRSQRGEKAARDAT